MSNDEYGVADEIARQTKGYIDGLADTHENRLPNAAINPADYGIRMGRAHRKLAPGSGQSEGQPAKQTFAAPAGLKEHQRCHSAWHLVRWRS